MKYFKNTSWLFAERIIRMAVGLFVGIWVARYLGPERFGLFSYVQSFVGLFAVVAALGLDGILVRELVANKNERDTLLGTAFGMKLSGAIVVLFFLAIAVSFTSNDRYTNMLVFIVASATVFQSFNVIDIYFQSKVVSRFVVYTNVISLLITSVLKIIFILNEASLLCFALVVVVDSFVLACGFVYFYCKKNLHIVDWRFEFATAINLFKDSWQYILSAIVVTVYIKIDQIMIKEMLDSEAVGYYAAAVRLSEVWYMLPGVIGVSLFPAILNAKKNNEDLYLSRLQNIYDLVVWMAVAIAVVVTIFSDNIIYILYGNQYAGSSSVLVIHIWAGLFVFLGIVYEKYLIAEKFTRKKIYMSLLGATSNVVFNFLLIPRYGIQGSAVATLFSVMLADYLYDLFDPDLRQQFIMKTKAFFPVHYLSSTFK